MGVAMLLHMASESVVEAVCTPLTIDDLKWARDECLSDSSTGNCPNYASKSNNFGCNNGGINGAMGDWDVSQVTDMEYVFVINDGNFFNADISKWNTSSVTNMNGSTCLSFFYFHCRLPENIFETYFNFLCLMFVSF